MNVRVVFRKAARSDVERTRAWYEAEQAGLGERFLSALDQVIDKLSSGPELYQIVLPARQVRRALLPTFPYVVYFMVEHERVVVLGVLHAARAPAVARGRR